MRNLTNHSATLEKKAYFSNLANSAENQAIWKELKISWCSVVTWKNNVFKFSDLTDINYYFLDNIPVNT